MSVLKLLGFGWISVLILFSCASGKQNQYLKSIEYTHDIFAGKGVVTGKVIFEDTGEAAAFANVYIQELGAGTTADFDGNFHLRNLEPGKYTLSVRYNGYRDFHLDSVEVKEDHILKFKKDLVLESYNVQLEKPIIYLYPDDTTDVNVNLILNGELSHTYPKSSGEWNVKAYPDGKLTDKNGREYYGLYWEGVPKEEIVPRSGNIVLKDSLVPFLEASLDQLGLNYREANEFIIYWLPQLEQNDYNLIYFAFEDYTDNAELIIDPNPETLIRVMMGYVPLDAPIDFPEQILPEKPERNGFTVVEWGGARCSSPDL